MDAHTSHDASDTVRIVHSYPSIPFSYDTCGTIHCSAYHITMTNLNSPVYHEADPSHTQIRDEEEIHDQDSTVHDLAFQSQYHQLASPLVHQHYHYHQHYHLYVYLDHDRCLVLRPCFELRFHTLGEESRQLAFSCQWAGTVMLLPLEVSKGVALQTFFITTVEGVLSCRSIGYFDTIEIKGLHFALDGDGDYARLSMFFTFVSFSFLFLAVASFFSLPVSERYRNSFQLCTSYTAHYARYVLF